MVKHSTPLPGNLALCSAFARGVREMRVRFAPRPIFCLILFFLALPSTAYSFAITSKLTSVAALRLLGEELHL
jgi:hypothetical protein